MVKLISIRSSILLALLVGANTCWAQFTLGVKAGGNYCITKASLGSLPVAGTSTPTAMNGFGYHGGVFAEIGLSERFFLRPELLYSLRAHSFDEGFDSTVVFQGFPLTARVEAEVRVQRAYLELPILVGFGIGKNISVVAGPAAMFLLSSRANTSGEFSVGALFQSFDLPFSDSNSSTEGLRSIGAAAVGGLNFRSEAGIDIGLRYWYGIDALEENTDLLRTDQSVLQISLGYAFLRNE